MSALKVALVITGFSLAAIQFIRPRRNNGGKLFQPDITRVTGVPDTIKVILKNACYDCHSDHTRYPWYFYTQPVAWFISGHIEHAKKELNFDEFGSYTRRRKKSKLRGIVNSIHDNTRPLPSYRLMHRDARLNKNEKELVMNWAERFKDSLSSGN